jgi:hypothetical protein
MVENVVGLRFIVEGEEAAKAALLRYNAALDENKRLTLQGAEAARRVEQDIRRVVEMRRKEQLSVTQASQSLTQLKRIYAQLNDVSIQKAGAEVTRLAAQFDAAADKAEQFKLRANFEAVVASVDKTAAASQRYARDVNVLNAAMEAGAITNAEYSRTLQVLQRRLDSDMNRDRVAALRAEDAELQQLEQRYNTVAVASRAYENAKQRLNRALSLGVINADRFQQEVIQLDKQFSQIGGSSARAATFVNQFGEATQIAGLKTNRFGLYAQQVGYQVGDFFVQIQSGTNAFVAFGQQATQLAGLLPGLAGAIVGIGISVSTALLSAWSRTKDAAETASDATSQFDGLGEALGRLDQMELLGLRTSLLDTITDARSEFESLLRLIEQSNLEKLRETLRSPIGGIQEAITGFQFQQDVAGRTGGAAPEFSFMGMSSPEQAIFVARQLQTLTGQTREELQGQLVAMQEAITFRGAMTNQVRTMIASLAEELGIVDMLVEGEEERGAALEDNAELAREALEALGKVRQEEQKRTADARARIADFQQEAELYRIIAMFGEDSAQADAKRRAIAAQQVEDFIRQNSLAGDLADNYRNAAMAAYDTRIASEGITTAISAAVTQADRLRSALSAAASAGDSRQQQIAVLRARIAAAESGGNVDAAGARAQAQFDVERITGPGSIESMAAGAIAAAEAAELARLTARDRELSRTPGQEGGSGGAAVVETAEIIANLQRELGYREQLAQLYGDQRRQREIEIDIEKQVGEEQARLHRQAITQFAAEYVERERMIAQYETFRETLDSLGQTFESTLEQGLMSMADGTQSVSDAFKTMARSIIAELYKVLVVQQIVGSASQGTGLAGMLMGGVSRVLGGPAGGILPQANGGVWHQGNHLSSFANGAVVTSAMSFPMANGGVGQMGEAGPESIMPLKRTRSGKLGVIAEGGGSTNVTVSPVFNFAAGATNKEEVRAEVLRMLPTITKATTSAVIDARGRGGVMRGTFRNN